MKSKNISISRIFIIFTLIISVLGSLNPETSDLNNLSDENQKDLKEKIDNIQFKQEIPKLNSPLEPDKYNRYAAYGYAYKWWDGANPNYNDYSGGGGDCANFVSQCLIAGG